MAEDYIEKMLQVDDEEVPYRIERSSRSTRMRIVAETIVGIRLLLPQRTPIRDGEKFIESNSVWVYKEWQRIAKAREKQSHLFEPFLEKNTIVYLGKKYQLVIDVGKRVLPPVVVEDGVIVVQCVKADLAEKILERWYRQQAKAVITGSLEYYRAKMDLDYNDLTIKDQKTRWGSCSSQGNLNFSWRLILAPKDVLDYVVVHELAHLVEMNHSDRFWDVVTTYFPDFKKQVKWLRENGVGLRI
ncbi:MAG: M48 family metallopeptidase [bacterium]|nr:M48 family metallopeptidase [bacterium]